MINAPINRQIKIKMIRGLRNLVTSRLTSTAAVLAMAKMATRMIRIIEIIVVDYFFMIFPPVYVFKTIVGRTRG